MEEECSSRIRTVCVAKSALVLFLFLSFLPQFTISFSTKSSSSTSSMATTSSRMFGLNQHNAHYVSRRNLIKSRILTTASAKLSRLRVQAALPRVNYNNDFHSDSIHMNQNYQRHLIIMNGSKNRRKSKYYSSSSNDGTNGA